MAGLRPRFVNTDPVNLNMDLDDLESKNGERTRAVSLVHLMGNPCDMKKVCKVVDRHDLELKGDRCEALGARFNSKPVGSFGKASTFSFFFSHHITTMEGGMVCTSDEACPTYFHAMSSRLAS